MKLEMKRQLFYGLSGLIGLFLVLTGVYHWSTQRMIRSLGNTHESQKRIGHLKQVVSKLRHLEGLYEGYIKTNAPSYKKRIRIGHSEIHESMKQFRRRVNGLGRDGDHPDGSFGDKINRLESLIRRNIQTMETALEDDSTTASPTQTQKSLRDRNRSINRLVDSITKDEIRIVSSIRSEAHATRRMSYYIIGGGMVSILGIGFLVTRRFFEEIDQFNDELREYQAERDRLVDIMENTPDVIAIADEQFEIQYINESGREHFGLAKDQSLDDLDIEDLHPEWAMERFRNEGFPTARDEGYWQGESAFINEDGDEIPVSQVITAHRNSDGILTHHSTVMRDIRDRKQALEQARKHQIQYQELAERRRETLEALTKLNRIATDHQLGLEEQCSRLLELGCDYFGLNYGFITRIEDETQTIQYAVGDHSKIQPASSAPIRKAYCRKTIERTEPMVIQNAEEEGWASDPAFDHFGLSCYLGGKLEINNEIVGTVCFADTFARDTEFTDQERTILELIIDWIQRTMESRRQQTQFRTLVENVPGVVYRCDYDQDWTMRFMSRTTRELTGYEPEELINNEELSYAGIIHPDDRDTVALGVHEAVENEESFELRYRIQTRDDQTKWVLERGQAIRDSEGEIDFLMGLIIDITEREQQQLALEKYQTISESLNDPVYMLDEEGRFEYVNDAFCELVHYERNEIIGAQPSLIKNESAVRKAERNLAQILSADGPDSLTFEIEIQPKNGDPIPCEDHMGVMPYEGETFNGSVGVLRDISGKKQRERELRQAEKLSALGEMSAGMMHEINNPNGFIQGNARLLKQDWEVARELLEQHLEDRDRVKELDREFLESLEEIMEGSDRIQEIVNNVKQFARGGQNKQEGERARMNPVSAGRDVMQRMEQIHSSQVEFELKSPDRPDQEQVQADPKDIEQVLMNLIDNAVQSAEESEHPTVGLIMEYEGDDFTYRVRDNGPGIPEEVRERMFDPFYTTKPTGKGTGLGLSIVNGIVDQLGGSISYHSPTDQPKEFVIRIPTANGFQE